MWSILTLVGNWLISPATTVPVRVVVRVRGPAGVDLGEAVARVDALHEDLPRRLADAVVDEAAAELALVVVPVDGADAVLDRVLAEARDGLDGAQRVVVGADARVREAARADRVAAEDLGRVDARGPVGLGHVAVPAGAAEVVLVEQPAERGQAGDVAVGREPGPTEHLDVVERPWRTGSAKSAVKAVVAALLRGRRGAAGTVGRVGDVDAELSGRLACRRSSHR